MTVSFTEAEYSEGFRLGKPCLVYLRNENIPILPRNIERDAQKLEALEKFKHLLQERHTIATFNDAHDLAVSVAADLSRTAQALEQTIHAEQAQQATADSSLLDELGSLLRPALENRIPEATILSAVRLAIRSLLTIEGKGSPQVFFSYSHADSNIVTTFAFSIRAEGVDVWIDQDRVSIGQSISDEVSRGLDSADFLAFFLSKNSISSRWAQLELNALMTRRIREKSGPIVFPILLDDTEVPALLRDVKYLDLRDHDITRGVRELSDSIRSVVAHGARL